MKKMSEGRKMWVSVMVVFAIYAVIFILFEDYDRRFIKPFDEASDWHLLLFSLIVMVGLGGMLLASMKTPGISLLLARICKPSV